MKNKNSIFLSGVAKATFLFGLAAFSVVTYADKEADLEQLVPSCVNLCFDEKSGKARRGCASICQAQEDTCAASGGSFEFQTDKYVCSTSENIGIAKK